MAKSLLVVESPAKARTLSKYLGKDIEVVASVGHISDLPVSRLGVDVDHGFKPEYEVIKGKQKIISKLKQAAKGKDIIYLGPDPDREGEAIAFHIAETLKGKNRNFQRVLFHELTPKAIKEALAHPEELSVKRYESQQARRILDRLVGYQISPLLWNRVKRGLSAGRVQSVALRIIVEREREIFAFKPEEYWSLTATLLAEKNEFLARLHKVKGKKADLKTEQDTKEIIDGINQADFVVDEIVSKERKRNPYPPFTTSTLQQEAYAKLRFSTSRTMRLAQQLYEGISVGDEGSVGLITYMRSDSVRISGDALNEVRGHIKGDLGPKFLPNKPQTYKNKKGSQDAHEAIRPTSVMRKPEQVKQFLEPNLFALYDLIWRRFVACQMTPAIVDQTSVDISASQYVFRATGSVIRFKGFLEIYDRTEKDAAEILPPMEKGQKLELKELVPKQRFTQPPPRFSEATLVKELESNGIGRPSTYAAIISTLKNKQYVLAARGQLSPTELGFFVNDLLIDNFPQIMNVEFTAGMENDLDEIEEGQSDWQAILKKFYDSFETELKNASDNMISLKRDGFKTELKCDQCGSDMVLKWGRNGPFLSCSKYPECSNATDYQRNEDGHIVAVKTPQAETNEECEKCGKPMVVKKGRYGAFLACSGYPDCKNTKPLNGDEGNNVPALPEGMDSNCPKCGAVLEVKKSRMGSLFIACSGYPKCKHTQAYPTGVKCPKKGCEGDIVERSSKKGVFYGCSAYPKCRFTLRSKPVDKSCPECGASYLVETPAGPQDDSGNSPAAKCNNKNCSYTTAVDV